MDFEKLLIDKQETITTAMRKLNENSMQILYVCDDHKLLASLTDGDIRRFLLNGGNLDDIIAGAANYKPKYLFEADSEKANEFMKAHVINSVPILDKHMNIIDIRFFHNWAHYTSENLISVPVVIQAGGIGKRLYPYTRILPKPLIPIGEIPITEHIINRFVRFGCKEFFMIVNHKKNMIKSYFNDIEKQYSITFIDETRPLGTGGGLSLLRGVIKKTFFLTNCDILIDDDYEKIYNDHYAQKNMITLVCAHKRYVIPYGVIETNSKGKIVSISEKPAYSYQTYTGMSVIEPQVLDDIPYETVITFPEIYDNYRKKNDSVGLYTVDENNWLDMGQLEELNAMKKKIED